MFPSEISKAGKSLGSTSYIYSAESMYFVCSQPKTNGRNSKNGKYFRKFRAKTTNSATNHVNYSDKSPKVNING